MIYTFLVIVRFFLQMGRILGLFVRFRSLQKLFMFEAQRSFVFPPK